MLAREFLYERLESLSRDFPAVQIKYKFNKWAKTHIVELTPVESYYTDTALENAWMNLVGTFTDNFPAGDISFISSDSILSINHPEFSFNVHEVLSTDYFSRQLTNLHHKWHGSFNSLTTNKSFWDIDLTTAVQMQFPLSVRHYPSWDFFNHVQLHQSTIVAKSLFTFAAWEEWQTTFLINELGDSTLTGSTQFAMAA
jgi:hypothetical protein